MKRTLLLALALALTACAPHPVAVPATVDPLERAAIDVRSWGRLVHRWTVDSDGAVEHVSNSAPFGSPARPLDVRRTTLDQTQRRALVVALQRVEAISAEPKDCATRVTDMPYGKLTWNLGGRAHEIDWESNCTEGRDERLWRAIKEADAIVDSAAKAAPVAGNLPNDEGGKGS